MATLREQIATNVLSVTKFRDLIKGMQANRPTDDLEIIKKDDAWKESDSYAPDELLPLAKLIDQAHSFMRAAEQADAKARKEAEPAAA